jgi:hypothetical protein
MVCMPIFERKYLQTNTASQLALSVSRAITPRANIAFVAEPAPTGGAVAPLAGLVNVDNVVEGDDVSGSLDSLVDLVATLQDNLAIPSHIRVDAQGRGELRNSRSAVPTPTRVAWCRSFRRRANAALVARRHGKPRSPPSRQAPHVDPAGRSPRAQPRRPP